MPSMTNGGRSVTRKLPLLWVMSIAVLGAPAVGAGETKECAGKTATIVGTNGDDVLHGTNNRDVIVALAGADEITGEGGNDLICSNKGSDDVIGGPGSDDLYAGRGTDRLIGRRGGDDLDGGPGRDRLWAGVGGDVLDGGTAKEYLGHNQGDGKPDDLYAGKNNDYCYGYEGDALKSCEGIVVE